jgi:hypothetical protein
MGFRKSKAGFYISAVLAVSVLSNPMLSADEKSDAEKQKQKAAIAEMQQRLNAQVMEKPFSVEDEKKIDEYVKDALAKDLKPEIQSAPEFWKPGNTCADIYNYGWNYYSNCRYYHRYYGRYW